MTSIKKNILKIKSIQEDIVVDQKLEEDAETKQLHQGQTLKTLLKMSPQNNGILKECLE